MLVERLHKCRWPWQIILCDSDGIIVVVSRAAISLPPLCYVGGVMASRELPGKPFPDALMLSSLMLTRKRMRPRKPMPYGEPEIVTASASFYVPGAEQQ